LVKIDERKGKGRYLAGHLFPKEQNWSGITEKKKTCSVVQVKFFLICRHNGFQLA